MKQPLHEALPEAPEAEEKTEEDGRRGSPDVSSSSEPAANSQSASSEKSGTSLKDHTPRSKDDEKEELSSTGSSRDQGSGEGYTADCSSDASTDLSTFAKEKQDKDNMIVSVNKLSLEDEEVAEIKEGMKNKKSKEGKEKRPGNPHHRHHFHQQRHCRRHQQLGSSSASTTDSDMANVAPVQWNGIKIVHPMDPRIDISKVGYVHQAPVGTGASSSESGGPQHTHSDEQPSLEHYLQLMEVVRPFFNSHGICSSIQSTSGGERLPSASEQTNANNDAREKPVVTHVQQLQPEQSQISSHNMQSNVFHAAPSAAGELFTGSQSSSSQSIGSRKSGDNRPQKDVPLHVLPEKHRPLLPNGEPAEPPPEVPLQLAARTKPLQAAAAAEFYAPDDPDENDNSDNSSMIVLARTKRKHSNKQPENTNASETSSQLDQISVSQQQKRPQVQQQQPPQQKVQAFNNGNKSNLKDEGIEEATEEEEEDRKPAARPLSRVVQQELGNLQSKNDERENGADNDDSNGQEEDQAQAFSSSSDQQRIHQKPMHAYDVPRVVTESSSNNNTTTSGSGSGGNSGSNQGSSGSGNGSSGNGSSGSGNENEGKTGSEDVDGTKDEVGADGNSNSEDINSDDRKVEDQNESARPVTVRKQPALVHNKDGKVTHHHYRAAKMEQPTFRAGSSGDHSEEVEAARERKLLDKKRKRMNMRREYEEKVQQEMESSDSSATHGAISLRPGKPVTLDKVLSFTKVARMVIQAGPPFLVVHTNAAYTRLTCIDAHAAVGKPVSALLSMQPQGNLPSSNINAAIDAPPEGSANQISSSSNGVSDQNNVLSASNTHLLASRSSLDWESYDTGQSYAEAAAAGVARAAQASQNDSPNTGLEPLVAACGFGKFHILYATARPHHMIGRNVAFVNKTGGNAAAALPVAANMRNDYGSSDTSLTSRYEGPFEAIACRASISPIVSDMDSAVVTDTNHDAHGHKNKRRKHHHSHNDQQSDGHSRSAGSHHRWSSSAKGDASVLKRYQQYITHYAVQLELFDESKELNQGSLSSSSTSVEANLLGLTKEELRRQRNAAHGGAHGTSQEESEERRPAEEDDEMASETTEGEVPVSAVG